MNVFNSLDRGGNAAGGSITLVVGGVRSGKSRFAEQLAGQLKGDDVLYVATAQSLDGEMTRRIEHHRRTRNAAWQTVESPLNIGRAIADVRDLPSLVLVDCLTLLVSNVMCDEQRHDAAVDDWESRVSAEVDELIEVARQRRIDLVIVSGEVGAGVVPEHAAGRLFRDLLGLANQRIAASADATYWMVAGLAINATKIASSVQDAAAGLQRSDVL